MLLPLSDIKPSPFNPKKPLTKKQYNAVKKGVEQFGFQRSLCVCKDFDGGNGYICLDGNTALAILADIGKKKVDCHIVDKVTDRKSLAQFMAAYSINKEPIYSEFAVELESIDFEEFTGLSFDKFSFEDIIDNFDTTAIEADFGDEANNAQGKSQHFLTLPQGAIDEVKSLVRSKAYKQNGGKAIVDKIDKLDETALLEAIFTAAGETRGERTAIIHRDKAARKEFFALLGIKDEDYIDGNKVMDAIRERFQRKAVDR
ncbi:hypothetical protein AGMMS49991_06850 [Spirochaetia bacterium]|nr:hypothetical protein AGMMS49991_06850 [Spirochaetia bacterium]